MALGGDKVPLGDKKKFAPFRNVFDRKLLRSVQKHNNLG